MKTRISLMDGSGRYRSSFRIGALRLSRKLSHYIPFGVVLNRACVIVVLILVLAASFITVWRIKVHTQSVLAEERVRLEKQNLIPFEKRLRPLIANQEIELWQSYQNTRAIARFKDSYFVASDGGLVELDSSGKLLRHYSVLDGLPESDLVSLSSFNAKLFIGTRAQGLVSFDGERFESYRWLDRSPQSINVLFEDGGQLLIGTMAGGLIEFDGQQFREIKAEPDHKRVPAIVCLAKNGARLYVGTFADGLWVKEGARWSQFTMADGLLSNRIVGVVADAQNLFVASDYGLAAASISSLFSEPRQRSAKLFRSVAVLPSLSSIVQFGLHILFCKDDGESFAFRVDRGVTPWSQLSSRGEKPSEELAGCRLAVLEHRLWMLSNDGIRRGDAAGDSGDGDNNTSPSSVFGVGDTATGPSLGQALSNPRANRRAPNKHLTNNLISALSLDPQGRLWAGGFRNGIDVLASNGLRLAHLESDTSRDINFLVADHNTKTMLAATSQGLLRFDADFRAIGRWSTTDGLLSNSVMQVAQSQASSGPRNPRDSFDVACATGKGLTIGVTGKWHSLTTVQGLPSNSVIAVLAQVEISTWARSAASL